MNICEANGISIMFDHCDGTLEIVSKVDHWKLAIIGNGRYLNLYHHRGVSYPFHGGGISRGYQLSDQYYTEEVW